MKFNQICPRVLRIMQFDQKNKAKSIIHHKISYSYRLLVLKMGTLTFHANGQSFLCKPGSVIYIPAKKEYCTEFTTPHFMSVNIDFDMLNDRDPATTNLRKYFVLTSQEKKEEYLSTIVDFEDFPIFNECIVINDFPNAIDRVQKFYEVQRKSTAFTPIELNVLILELLIDIAKYLSGEKKTSRAIIAEQVLEYIKANITEKLTVPMISNALSYHPTSLNRIVREDYGCSLHQLIIREKINVAIQLLSESDMSVTDIAYHLSFYDSAHFSKTFYEIAGCLPSDIRKNHK